jgi:hypothetical protein
MSSITADMECAFSPFYAIVETGLKRMFEFVKSDCFTFVVNGQQFESTIAEAVLISPAVCDLLRRDTSARSFVISSSDIESNDFGLVLQFVRSFDTILSKDRALSLLTVFNILGNDQLSFVLLASMNLSKSKSVLDSTQSQPVVPLLGVKQAISSCDETIEYCASTFSNYSTDALRSLSRNALHILLSSESLRLDNEDLLLRTLLELGKDYLEYLKYVEVIFLSQEGITLFVDNLPFCEVTSDLWSKIVCRLKGDSDDSFRRRRISGERQQQQQQQVISFESTILSTKSKVFDEFEGKQWRLLYRGSRDGFCASNFHNNCDGQSNTITIILTNKGFIFGGFSSLAWDSSGQWKADNARKSFVFSIRNPHNITDKKFSLINPTHTIGCISYYGPLFGSANDIQVADDCNNNTSSYTNLGNSYANDTGIAGTQFFTGEYNFTVKEIEVFQVSN